MGRNGGKKRGRTQRRDFRDGRDNVWKKTRPQEIQPAANEDGDPNVPQPGWAPFVKESPTFETYYKEQGILPEAEWDEFISTLRTPLRTTFRVNARGQFANEIKDQMHRDFFNCLKDGIEIDGEIVKPVHCLSWYPENLAWHLSLSRMQLRKLPILERIHEFLKQENEIGNITRQEAVSMLPPLFLDVRPEHRILDMCAAPGSKTFQLLEMIHHGEDSGDLPKGMVIANDLDVQRCHLLIHQTKRMCSPNILVTNHEAQHFPGLKHKSKEGITDKNINGLLFDRILCDVPCSGDGTIRKAPDIWRKWNSGMGNGLHRLQVQIAMRGVALLQVGGRLVYSTCSLNPIEDEAVVAEIIRQSQGCMELLDVSTELPGLKRRPGLTSWKVRDKQTWLCSSSQVNRHRAGTIVPSMFPSGRGWICADGSQDNVVAEVKNDTVPKGEFAAKDFAEEGGIQHVELEKEVSDLPLERCMRILPHDQDTGGFFIAVLRKVTEFKSTQFAPKFQKDACNAEASDKGLGSRKIICSGSQIANHLNDDSKLHEGGYMDKIQGDVEHEGPTDIDYDVDNALQNSESGSPDGSHLDDVSELPENAGGSKMLNSNNMASSYEADQKSAMLEARDSKASEHNPDNINTVSCHRPDQKSAGRKGGKVQQQGRWRGVDPVIFLTDEKIIDSLVFYYGIKDTFPLRGHLIVRSEDPLHLKRIYYVSKSVADVIRLNFSAGEVLKITSAGLKIFERHSANESASPCSFRIASEGLSILLPHITKQVINASEEDFKLLLSSPTAVSFSAFSDPSFVSASKELLLGCCVVFLAKDDSIGEEPIAISCWRGRTNLSLLVPRVEADQMLQRLFPVQSEGRLCNNNKEHGLLG